MVEANGHSPLQNSGEERIKKIRIVMAIGDFFLCPIQRI